MSFSDIFKKGFLDSFSGNDITFRYALITMMMSLLLATVIGVVYYFKARKYFFSKEFAVALIALSVITTSVILTIQSSLVVSLGMVGALSIVRFRTAVKNPLDLVFLFWAIVVGIICGTGLFFIAILMTIILGIALILSDELPGIARHKIIVLNGSYPYETEELETILKQYTRYWNYRTKNIHGDSVSILIEVKGLKEEDKLIESIVNKTGFIDVSVLIQEGAID